MADDQKSTDTAEPYSWFAVVGKSCGVAGLLAGVVIAIGHFANDDPLQIWLRDILYGHLLLVSLLFLSSVAALCALILTFLRSASGIRWFTLVVAFAGFAACFLGGLSVGRDASPSTSPGFRVSPLVDASAKHGVQIGASGLKSDPGISYWILDRTANEWTIDDEVRIRNGSFTYQDLPLGDQTGTKEQIGVNLVQADTHCAAKLRTAPDDTLAGLPSGCVVVALANVEVSRD